MEKAVRNVSREPPYRLAPTQIGMKGEYRQILKVLELTLCLYYNKFSLYTKAFKLSPGTLKFAFAIDVYFWYAGVLTANRFPLLQFFHEVIIANLINSFLKQPFLRAFCRAKQHFLKLKIARISFSS